jgi:hypothetical protein
VKEPKKKGGRPPKHKGGRLSKNRTFRVRGNLDAQLRAAAADSGRSVSEEIEARLDRSFHLDSVLSTVAGKRAQIIQALTASVSLSGAATVVAPLLFESQPPGSFTVDDQDQYPVMKVAAAIIIDAFAGRPPPADEEIDAEVAKGTISDEEYVYKIIGQTVAMVVLQNLGVIDPIVRYGDISESLKPNTILGRLANTIMKRFKPGSADETNTVTKS